MTPERFRQIRNLFDAALDRDTASRVAFLAEAAQGDPPLREEVERLLAAHQQATGLLEQGVRPELLTGEPDRMEGRRIDHYEILRELGRGGMGAVYLALRTDDVYRKAVALKVVRPEAGTPEVIRRFRREREILASLDHPNLARLLDGGATPEGLPYFVMDYVEGQPIDAYCDERQLNVEERLKLFRSVSAAVAYAHSRGVVHRDLKPGNILVTAEGVVKLLDFGIAKLLCAEAEETAAPITLTGMRLMTPEYASPEQVRGEAVGTASDIYSLGVILYELLTGHRPYRLRSRLIHEVVRVICEEEPTRPSTAVTEVEQRLAVGEEKPVTVTPESVSRARAATPTGLRRQLSGDPDKIVLKALRKDPAQRYPAAEAFGEDIRRHLEGLPVLAQGESLVYRAWKLLLRYRLWVLAAAVIAAGVASGMVKINPLGPNVVVIKPAALLVLFVLCVLLLWGCFNVSSELGRGATFGEWFLPALMFAAYFLSVIGLRRLAPNLEYPEGVSLVTLLAMMVVWLILRVRWHYRARQAGPLLLDLGKQKKSAGPGFLGFLQRVDAAARRPLTVGVLAWFLAAMAIVTVVWFRIERSFDKYWQAVTGTSAPDIVIGVIWITTLFIVPYVRARTEIRQHGILHRWAFLRWPRIESYAWQQAKGESVVLTLRTKSLFHLPWTFRIVLTADQKGPMNAILARQLAHWPINPPEESRWLEDLYGQMSDEQLEIMEGKIRHLTDNAQRVLQAEISKRGLPLSERQYRRRLAYQAEQAAQRWHIQDASSLALTIDGLLPPELEDDTPDDADYAVQCPKCGSRETVFQGRALPASVPGLDNKYNWTCDACGHQWKDDGLMEKQ